MSKNEIDIALLREVLEYDPETGIMIWRKRGEHMFRDGAQSAKHACGRWNSRYAGTRAFTAKNAHDYLHGSIFGSDFLAHRVAFAIENGVWPNGEIDHIDGDRSNNSIGNLRVATRLQNTKNTKRRSDNSSGSKGVYMARNGRSFYAQITSSLEKIHLGTFGCKTAASVAYAVHSRRLHGDFGRLD